MTDWDERHRAAPPDEPCPPIGWEEASLALPPTGRALDVACGKGAGAVWAALQGIDVVALDASMVAIDAVDALSAANDVGPRVDARVHDLETGLPADLGRFDLVVCQRYRDPRLVPALLAHLAASGVAVLSVLSVVGADRTGRHHAPPGELRAAVDEPGFTVRDERESGGLATVVVQRDPSA